MSRLILEMSITFEIINRVRYFLLAMWENLSGIYFLHFLKMWHFWLVFGKHLATCKMQNFHIWQFEFECAHTVFCVLILYKIPIVITINIITTKERQEMGNLRKKWHLNAPKMPPKSYITSIVLENICI